MKKSLISLFLFSTLLIMFSSCAAPMYYWGKYPDTYYKNIKRADDMAYQRHRECLMDIITTSGEKKLRVPPGIYAELGYLLIQEDPDEAKRYFQLEMDTYPESQQLMKLLIDNM